MSRISGWMTIVSHPSLSLLRILSIIQITLATVDCMSPHPDPPTLLTHTLFGSGPNSACLDSIRMLQGARGGIVHIVHSLPRWCLGHSSPPTISELDLSCS